MAEVRPLLETAVDMTAAPVERADLDPRVLMIVRLGALAAVDASAASYVLNLATASDAKLTPVAWRQALRPELRERGGRRRPRPTPTSGTFGPDCCTSCSPRWSPEPRMRLPRAVHDLRHTPQASPM